MKRRKNKDEDYEENDEDDDEDYEEDCNFPELEKCAPKLKKEYKEVQKTIKSTEPTILSVLSMKILQEDKAELVQLLDIYVNFVEESSLEKLELRKKIQTKIQEALVNYKEYQKFSDEKHKKFKKEIQLLEEYKEYEEMKYTILQLNATTKNKQAIYSQYKKLLETPTHNDEFPKLKNWLQWALSLPYDNLKETTYNISNFLLQVRQKMDEEFYGMKKVKESILIFLNSRMLNPNMQKCSLGLLGPRGCGKTSIVRILASILDFPLEQISLGGITNADYLKGHSFTYIGSEPGEIVKCLSRLKVKNGILFFDEYDKISSNKEVCSALLHITDSAQNNKFQDNFLRSIDIDLSHIWFIYSMNSKPTDNALADRISYIEIDGYTQQDKFLIVRDYILKKIHKNMNWKENSLTFKDDAITYLIEKVSPSTDLGVRSLDFAITTIANKINFLHHNSDQLKKFNISFDIGQKLKFPFVLEKKHIDIFINNF